MTPGPFVDDRHALYCGWVLGSATRHGLNAVPVRDGDGNYLPELLVRLAGLDVRLVIPYPPADWSLVDGPAVNA